MVSWPAMKKTFLSVIGVACLIVAGSGAGQPVVRSSNPSIRPALFAALRPVRLANCTLRRFGSAHDGGYLMCENLIDQAQSAYSYGIGARGSFCASRSRLSIGRSGVLQAWEDTRSRANTDEDQGVIQMEGAPQVPSMRSA